MPKFQSLTRIALRFFAVLLGLGLLGYLVFRTGPGGVWKQVREVGWGLALIIILGGFSQLIKTCAWRQKFASDISGLSWSRSFGVQLVSDAAGQLGLAGKLLGRDFVYLSWVLQCRCLEEYRPPRLTEDCMP